MALPLMLLRTFRPITATPQALALAAGLVALTVSAGAMSPAWAQPAPGDHAERPMHQRGGAKLSVTGQGSATSLPDLARISVGVSVQADTAAAAMSENATLQQAVIDKLKASGIEDRDIQTSGLNLSPVQDYSRDGKPPVLTGYRAQNMVSLRVRDLSKLGEVLDSLVSSGANEINGISFELENMSEVEDAARINAIAAAKHRAEVMAQASGHVLGPLVSLSDGHINTGPQPMMAARMQNDSAGSTPIQAGELSFDANVTAVYLLLPADQEDGAGQ